ncbi:helix-turn-helix domain-containing protein [Streptomyces sp. NPDC002324]
MGRPPAMTEAQVRHARALLTDPENTITSIAKLLGVSRTTVYKYVPELAAGRNSLAGSPRPAPSVMRWACGSVVTTTLATRKTKGAAADGRRVPLQVFSERSRVIVD